MAIRITALQQCNLVLFGKQASIAHMQQAAEVDNRQGRQTQRGPMSLQVKPKSREECEDLTSNIEPRLVVVSYSHDLAMAVLKGPDSDSTYGCGNILC